MLKNVQQTISQWWQSAKKVLRPVYLLNGTAYDWNEQGNLSKTDRFYIFAIVSRLEYKETTKAYPAMETAELKKVVQLDSQSKSASFHLWPVATKSSNKTIGKRYVTFWSMLRPSQNITINVPETKIITDSINQEVIEYQAGHDQTAKTIWVAKTDKAIASTLRTALVTDAQSFIMSAGLGLNRPIKTLPHNELFTTLLHKPLWYWLKITPGFLPKLDVQSMTTKLKPLFIQAAALFVIYMAVTSLYLVAIKSYYQGQVSSFRQETIQVIDKQATFEDAVQEIEGFNTVVEQKDFLSVVFPVYVELKKAFDIRVFKKTAGLYIVEGTAQKATDVLAFLNTNKQVNNARFQQPTSSVSGKERFVIGFNLAKQGDLNAE